MTTRTDIIEAIRLVDARLDGLQTRILEDGDRPLPEGTWRVRDALSHLAARANGVERVLMRLRAHEAGTPIAQPLSIDEINAGQVEERTSLGAADLLAEIRAGHAGAISALGQVDDETLAKMLPQGFRPGESAVADQILRGGPGHDANHIDQIEAALGA